MINDLIDAINLMLVEKFPKTKVYVTYSKKGFDRPSFFISYVSGKQDDLNRNAYTGNINIQVVYFSPLDDYMNVDLMAQNQEWDEIRSVFSSGYIKVGDRAAKIKELTGGPRDSEIYLNINIDFTQDRIFNTPDVPVAQEVDFQYELNGEQN